jgi:putative chitinase
MEYTHTIGPNSLRKVCPSLSVERSKVLAKALGTALHKFEPGIGEYASAHFIGQCAHESGEFKWPRELWGPSAVQSGYWKRRDIQGDGPLYPGLGYLARGGGWIQTTGRVNYRRAAKRLGFKWWGNLARKAHEPYYASALATIWWADHFPRDMSGPEWTIERVTRTVNGGTNGLPERIKYTKRALGVRKYLNPEKL